MTIDRINTLNFKSIKDIVIDLKEYDLEGLMSFLVLLLREKDTSLNTPLDLAPEAFILEIFKHADLNLQDNLNVAYSNIIEQYEISNNVDDNKLINNVLSLAGVFKSTKAKKRIRRWLYSKWFDNLNWKYDDIDVFETLLLANSKYDPDEYFLEYLKNNFININFTEKYSKTLFRIFLQIDPPYLQILIPKILIYVNLENNEERIEIGYFCKLTIDKFGAKLFFNYINTFLENSNNDNEISKIFSNIKLLHKYEFKKYYKHPEYIFNILNFISIIGNKLKTFVNNFTLSQQDFTERETEVNLFLGNTVEASMNEDIVLFNIITDKFSVYPYMDKWININGYPLKRTIIDADTNAFIEIMNEIEFKDIRTNYDD